MDIVIILVAIVVAVRSLASVVAAIPVVGISSTSTVLEQIGQQVQSVNEKTWTYLAVAIVGQSRALVLGRLSIDIKLP